MTCVFAAAIVRGYSGFGFSLLAITSLSLMLPPAEIIPPIFMMEVAASLSLLPGIWKDIHWRSLALLGAGCLVGTPVGVWFLASVPAAPMKIVLAAAVLVSVGFLWFGYTRKTMPSAAETIATGGITGLLNGALGIGGPPIVIFFFNSPAGVAIGRASLIAFFIATDAMALGFLAAERTGDIGKALPAFLHLFLRCWRANGSAHAASRQRIRQISAAGYWSCWSRLRF